MICRASATGGSGIGPGLARWEGSENYVRVEAALCCHAGRVLKQVVGVMVCGLHPLQLLLPAPNSQ